MPWSMAVFGSLLVLLLAAVGVSVGWRQLGILRATAGTQTDEGHFHRRLAYRRLTSGVLMLALAGLLAGMLLYLEDPTMRLAAERHEQALTGEPPPLLGHERDLVRISLVLWITFLLLLFAVMMLALADVWAIRRFARRQYRKLRDDRRSMIARQATRLRRERDAPPDVSVN